MNLRNCLPHMRGESVKVGDTVYQIDENGVARDVAMEHAKQLLKNGAAWQVHTERLPVAEPPVAEPPVAEPPEAEPTPPEETTEASEAAETTAEPGGGTDGTGLLEEASAGTEWPDPSEDLGIEYLRQMAEAHDVKYSDRTSAKKLVKQLQKVMFD